jgi:hypothetical protein
LRDRIPTQPNRRLIAPEGGGTPFYATVERADNPASGNEGTPLNKANLLTDATATGLGLSGDGATPDAALGALTKFVNPNEGTTAGVLGHTATPGFVELVRYTATSMFDPASYPSVNNKYDVYIVGGGGGGGANMGSGGGGGYCKLIKNLTLTASTIVAVGSGGASTTNGGTTSFAGYTAAGGSAGISGSQATGGAGGSGGGTGGGSSYYGGAGGSRGSSGYNCAPVSLGSGGQGGGCLSYTPVNPYNGIEYGCGGGGAGANGGGSGGNTRGTPVYPSEGGGGAGDSNLAATMHGGNGGGGGGGGFSSAGGVGGVGMVIIYGRKVA